jgi:two-component system, NtrC family, sensor histidine kinase GlrK
MRMVAQGDLQRSLRVRGPREVAETIRVFNHMVKQLAERDSLHADFLAQMSHELRTPLTAIQEGSALLLEEIPGALNASQREIVQVVHSNNERLFGRLTSILELSKMEARKMEYALVVTDLIALLKRSVEAIGPISQKKRLRMTLHTPSPLPAMYLDEDRIRQVLDNLLSNAVKFTPDGSTAR